MLINLPSNSPMCWRNRKMSAATAVPVDQLHMSGLSALSLCTNLCTKTIRIASAVVVRTWATHVCKAAKVSKVSKVRKTRYLLT